MTARVAFLQHSEWDLPGILGERARELRFTTETFRADRGADALPRPGAFDLLVIMGSAESATNRQLRWIDDERRLVAHAVTAGIPVLMWNGLSTSRARPQFAAFRPRRTRGAAPECS
jgi:GMP synthase-like glutamine amidotransferase